jgi:hypothetical protein
MLTVVIVVALAGMLGGYVTSKSSLTERRRDRWERRRDIIDAYLHDELDLLDPPFGVVALDMATIPAVLTPATGWQRRRLHGRWAVNALLSCATCSGVWWCAGVLGLWALVAAVTGQAGPVAWSEAVPVWMAAAGLHVALTGAGNRAGIW